MPQAEQVAAHAAEQSHANSPDLLEIVGLAVDVRSAVGEDLRIVDGVDLRVRRREIVGLVGESGSGKSLLGRSILRLPGAGARIRAGAISLDGRDLAGLRSSAMRQVRGTKIGFMPQNYTGSLNHALSVGRQIQMIRRAHHETVGDTRSVGIRLLEETGVPDPEKMIDAYPHQFSGGMLQRAVLSVALCCDPDLLIADEPTTALDATMRDRVLATMAGLRTNRGMSVLIITHDLSTLAGFADRIYIMYAGRIVESGTTADIFADPQHPYTRALLDSIPQMGGQRRRLKSIPGSPPDFAALPSGCRFAPRCAHAFADCDEYPPPIAVGSDNGEARHVACWLHATRAGATGELGLTAPIEEDRR